MAKKIELIECAPYDLSVRYSRHVGDKKIVQYRSSVMQNMVSVIPPRDRLKARLEKEEGQEVELEITSAALGRTIDGQIKTEPLDSFIFNGKDGKKIKKALNRFTAKSMVIERVQFNKWHAFYSVVNKAYNFLTGKGIRFGSYRNVYDLTCYLSVAAPAGNALEAIESLKSDLKMLADHNLIRGNLAMPQAMMLANTEGLKELTFGYFCFFVLDTERIRQITNTPAVFKGNYEDLLKSLGLKNVTYEGSISWLNNKLPTDGYDIQSVDIDDPTDIQLMIEENYFESRDIVEQAARETAKLIALTEESPEKKKEVMAALIARRDGQ